MLDHIHIENFRLFKNLDIPKVGQVNLITGKNNCGKTTLLEALRLWGNRDSLVGLSSVLDLILIARGEVNGSSEAAYKSIFHHQQEGLPVEINGDVTVSYTTKPQPQIIFKEVSLGKSISNVIVANDANDASFFVPASFELRNARLWQKIDLTEKEEKVAEILRIIEPSIVRVSVDTADGSAKVRLSNSPKPVPLKNFGEGMNRLLTIALGLVSAENDMLLIDEIDIGLHHSVQRTLWEIVFQKARDLNVQVFATTHSSDCVAAFSDVASKPEYVGMGNYMRLERSRKDGEIVAVEYDVEALDRSLEFNLETR